MLCHASLSNVKRVYVSLSVSVSMYPFKILYIDIFANYSESKAPS